MPVRTASDVRTAAKTTDLVIVSVPAFAHERFVTEILPGLRPGATLLFMGEGSGSLVARPMPRAAGRDDVAVGETNCLPFIARTPAPGTVTVDRKRGGVLLAATPVARTPELVSRIADVWPFVEEAPSVLETTLVNYDAIDVVPVAVASVGTLRAAPAGCCSGARALPRASCG